MNQPLLQPLTASHTIAANAPVPKLAIIFHCSGQELSYVTAHEVVRNRDGLPMLSGGRMALPSDERRISDLIASRKRSGRIEIAPANLLHSDQDVLAWWLPPVSREMLLLDHAGAEHVITARWPSLVALVVRRKLYLVAVEGDARPTTSTAVFNAPVGNVYSTTNVCTGSVRLPTTSGITDMAAWSAVLTDSWWGHDNHSDAIPKPAKSKGKAKQRFGNYRATEFWLGREGTEELLTAKDMVPTGLTVGAWLESIIDTDGDA